MSNHRPQITANKAEEATPLRSVPPLDRSPETQHAVDLRHEITKTIKHRSDIDFAFVRLNRYEAILDRFAERFLVHGQQDLRLIWLWTSLKHEISASKPHDVFTTLRQRLSPLERYWFIASDEHSKYWVAEASGAGIIETVSEMYGFEYYISDLAMTWMLCENHHGVLIEASADLPQFACPPPRPTKRRTRRWCQPPGLPCRRGFP